MMDFLTGEVVLSALADIGIYLIILIVLYILCRSQRLAKDIVKNALEDTQKMKKSTKAMTTLIRKRKAERRVVRKTYWKFRQKVRNTRSILQVFIYENGDDPDINYVVSLLTNVIEETNKFAKAFNTQSKDEILECLKNTDEELCKIEEVLSSVVKRKEDKALARL